MVTVMLLATAACDTSTPGSSGVLDFSPTDCGRIGCSFENPIAVGSIFSLQLAGDANIRSLEIRSDDPRIFGVTVVPDVAGRPTWDISAIAVGETTLEAIEVRESQDGTDEITVVDRLAISVSEVSTLKLSHFLGVATGPTPADGVDESWTVEADQPVSFRVTPFDESDAPMLGRFEYTVVLDDEIRLGLIDQELDEGRLYVRVPLGRWSGQWTDGQRRSLSAEFVAE